MVTFEVVFHEELTMLDCISAISKHICLILFGQYLDWAKFLPIFIQQVSIPYSSLVQKKNTTKEIKLTANSLPQHYMFGEMRYVNLATLQNISFTSSLTSPSCYNFQCSTRNRQISRYPRTHPGAPDSQRSHESRIQSPGNRA